MLEQFWKKEVVVEVQLASEDTADCIDALPLFFAAKWNHYLGFYHSLIQQFYEPSQPFPYHLDYFWLELASPRLPLNGTEIISHLFLLHALPQDTPLQLICHFRRASPSPIVDLKQFFKSSLKASTCIRYGKFGSSVITVEMTVNNIDDMFANFRESKLDAYLGELNEDSEKLGYRFIVEKKEKIEKVPVKVVGRDFVMERGVSKKMTL